MRRAREWGERHVAQLGFAHWQAACCTARRKAIASPSEWLGMQQDGARRETPPRARSSKSSADSSMGCIAAPSEWDYESVWEAFGEDAKDIMPISKLPDEKGPSVHSDRLHSIVDRGEFQAWQRKLSEIASAPSAEEPRPTPPRLDQPSRPLSGNAEIEDTLSKDAMPFVPGSWWTPSVQQPGK